MIGIVSSYQISKNATDQLHTIIHEVAHFLLSGSPDNPDGVEEHNKVGGIFQYAERRIEPDGTTTILQGTADLSQENIEMIVNDVPLEKETEEKE